MILVTSWWSLHPQDSVTALFFYITIDYSHTSILQGAFCASCIYAITRPYKLNFMDIIILFLLEILMLVTSITIVNIHYSGINTVVTCLVLHMILIFCVCHKLAKKIGITQCLKRRYNNLKRCMQATRPTREAETLIPCHTDWNHRRVWTSATHHIRTHSCWTHRKQRASQGRTEKADSRVQFH